MNQNIKIWLLLIILFVFVTYTVSQTTLKSSELKCIISDQDGEKYCVRDRVGSKKAANLLAIVVNKLIHLVDYLKKKYPMRENVKRLVQNFNPKAIQETLPTSTYTAYSEDKGQRLAFCLSKNIGPGENGNPPKDLPKNIRRELIDENTLTFVALHELAHIATKEIGHTSEFWHQFKFLLKEAVNISIYNPVDYSKQPVPYCGLSITDSPLFD